MALPRTAVQAAGLAGLASAGLVGALPSAALLVAAVLYVGAVHAGTRLTGTAAKVSRNAAAGLTLVLAAVVLSRLDGQLDPLALKGSLGLLLVGAQVGQALTWTSRSDVRSGLVAAMGLLVLSASYAPDLLVGVPLVVGWVAVLVALAQLQGMASVLPVTGAAVVLGLVAFLLVPVPLDARIHRGLGGTTPAPDRGGSGSGAFSGDSLDLSRRGALPTDPVLSVPADSPTLWRASAFNLYDGRSWSRPSSEVLAGGPTYDIATPMGPTRSDRAFLRGATDGTIWSPGPLVSVTATGSRIPLVDEFGAAQLPGLQGGYSVVSDVLVTDQQALASRRGNDATDERWRSLPVSVPDRVGALAREITAGAASRYDAALAIEQWLRTHATYRLDSPVPGPSEDAVDRFLFVDKTGFCEQFASAETVLLRTLGIPSRLVTGLAYGVPEGADRRLYRVSDLHAWVELWVPGTGWVTSDPTAGVPLAQGSGSGLSLRARLSNAIATGLRAFTPVPGGRTGLALILLLLTAVVAVVAPRRPRFRHTPEVVGQMAGGPALQAFLRFDTRRGSARRRPAESLRELAVRVEPEVAAALQVVEQECYAPVQPDVRAAVDVLDRY